MPILRRAGLVLMLAAFAAACDSDDPLSVASRTAQLYVAAPGATVRVYDVYEVFQDNDGDGPDDIDGDGLADVSLYCQAIFFASARSVPWHFRIEVLITSPDGATIRRLTSDAAATDEAPNRALYDEPFPPGTSGGAPPGNPSQSPPGISDPTPNLMVGGVQRDFFFRNPSRRFATDRSLILSTSNPLHELRPVLFDGLCPGATIAAAGDPIPGEAMIDFEAQPYTFTINEGETVTVRATLATRDQQAALTPSLMEFILTDPSIAAALVVGGQTVTPQGTTEGSQSISFTYTVR
jgi:hypothetical protein